MRFKQPILDVYQLCLSLSIGAALNESSAHFDIDEARMYTDLLIDLQFCPQHLTYGDLLRLQDACFHPKVSHCHEIIEQPKAYVKACDTLQGLLYACEFDGTAPPLMRPLRCVSIPTYLNCFAEEAN